MYFPPDRPPPPHMPVAYGPVEICKDSLVSASCKSSRSALGDGVPVVMEEEEERGVHGEEEEFPKCTLCLCEDQVCGLYDGIDSSFPPKCNPPPPPPKNHHHHPMIC